MRITGLFLALLLTTPTTVTAQEAGRITRIEFRPANAEEGGGVIVGLIGSGSCSYTIDYGDGQTEKRTAAILPDRLQHKYADDGEYLVVATPEAPCEGTARATLDIRAINRGLWGLSAEPGVAAPDGVDVTITVNGRGECSVALDYGDGTADTIEGALPAKRTHRYAKAGTYVLKATTAAPCRGEATVRLEIAR